MKRRSVIWFGRDYETALSSNVEAVMKLRSVIKYGRDYETELFHLVWTWL
jgi:hypothetical protein